MVKGKILDWMGGRNPTLPQVPLELVLLLMIFQPTGFSKQNYSSYNFCVWNWVGGFKRKSAVATFSAEVRSVSIIGWQTVGIPFFW